MNTYLKHMHSETIPPNLRSAVSSQANRNKKHKWTNKSFFFKNRKATNEIKVLPCGGDCSPLCRCYQRFLEALHSLSFGEAFGEVTGNGFVFFAAGLVRGVVAEVVVAVLVDVLPFRLLGCLGLVQIGWLGVYCGGVGVNASAAWPSAMMAVMTSSSCFACSDVGMALVAATASSISICSISPSEAGGVAIFSLPLAFPLPTRTGIGGSMSRSFSSSS